MTLCSIAIAAGVLGVVMAVKGVMFRRRFGGRGPWALAACGPGFGHGHDACGGGPDAWRGHGPWRRGFGGGGPGRSRWLRWLFSRLDTTPGQEREIRAALDDLQRSAHEAKEGMKDARGALARAVGGEVFDDGALGEAQGRVDASANQMKDAFTSALKRIHAVLDARQRERLAELLANGPTFRGGWRNPYRDAAI